jgi:signal transduction histidine kinase
MIFMKKIRKNIRLLKKILFNNDSEVQNLVLKHLLALVIVSLTIVTTFVLLLHLNSLKSNDAHYINLSGQQRYLSQQAALFMHKHYEHSFNYTTRIVSILQKIDANQKLLKKSIPKENLMLFESIDKELANFLSTAVTLLENKSSDEKLVAFEEKSQKLLQMFDKATSVNEEVLIKKIAVFESLIVASGIFLLITILIEAIFIFRPAILEIMKKTGHLKSLNEKLEQKIAAAIEKNREQEMLLMQKTKSAEMGELVNNIAHQWRQPITIASLYVDTVIMDLDDEPLDKNEILNNLEKTKQTLVHMSQTIDDFRSFFIPANKTQTFDIVESINRVEKLLHHHFMHHKISISQFVAIPTHDNQYCIKGKRGELEQCLMILFNNAKDAIVDSRQNGNACGNIDISLYKERHYIVIKVTDDGGGIPEDIQKNIFKPYFSTKKDSGTGVGLYMCQNIICNRFGGKIYFQSHSHKTSFFIQLDCNA